jgi:hypothetical protein
MPKHIDLRIDPVTGDLQLSDGGRTPAGALGNIKWSIKDSKIDSFKIERKDRSPDNIFFATPEQPYGTSLNLIVGFNFSKDWYYSIYWKDKATQTEHTFDPIIAIKPHGIALLSLLIAVPLIALSAFLFFKFRNSNRGFSKTK